MTWTNLMHRLGGSLQWGGGGTEGSRQGGGVVVSMMGGGSEVIFIGQVMEGLGGVREGLSVVLVVVVVVTVWLLFC